MVDAVARLFGIIGLDITPPGTLSELIPYILTVAVGIGLVAAIFRLFRAIIMALITRNPRL